MIVMPPARSYRRSRRWETFEKLFVPIARDADGSLLWEPWEVPSDANPRYWWTVLDCDGRLILSAGFRFVNRLNFVVCTNAWGGECAAHPEYRY